MRHKIIFNGLNELRALAALCVVFHHIELYCAREGRASLSNSQYLHHFVAGMAINGVYLFFVLSGFLITFLLLSENASASEIDIRKFYLRRIFRIWPLYFIIIFLSIVVLPAVVAQTHFFDTETYFMARFANAQIYGRNNILLYILLLSNFGLPIVGAAQTWSVSVEEQFYLIWPHLVKRFTGHGLLLAFIGLFIGIKLYKTFHLPYYEYLYKIPLQIMAIGGVFGYLWYYWKDKIIWIFKSNILFIITMAVILTGLFFPIHKLIIAFFFGVAILFVITKRRFNLRNQNLAYLGTISYGIYMYHPLMMFIVSATINKFFLHNDTAYKILFYFMTLLLTIIISHYSYKLIEKKMIAFKDRKFSNTNDSIQ